MKVIMAWLFRCFTLYSIKIFFMKQAYSRGRRIVIVVCICLAAFVVLCIAFISPITRHLVEKYDVQYTGRQIEMDWAYVNPFTGYVHFDNLKSYEAEKDTVFFSARGVTASFSMRKLLGTTYEIAELKIDRPWGIVIQ